MFQVLNDVPFVENPRISTGYKELDWIYGGDDCNWGLPKGKISLWSGPSGTGKSRSLISIAKKMSSDGHRIMYFQNEVTLSDFRSWAVDDYLPDTFYGSEATSLDEQLSDIENSGADVAIIDSVNQIKEFGGGHKAAINNIYNRYREITKRTGVHVIFICQLDKQNLIKGGSELLFLADITITLGFHVVDKKTIEHHFTVGIGNKHRYGRMGESFVTTWKHIDGGTTCISNNRLNDKVWCDSHGLTVNTNIPFGHFSKKIVDPVSGSYMYEPDPKFFTACIKEKTKEPGFWKKYW